MAITSNRNACGAVTAKFAIGLGIALCAANVARSADWTVNPRLQLGGSYDDNYLMTPESGDPVSVSGADLEGRAEFLGTTPTGTMSFTPRVHTGLYDESDFNTVDYYLDSRLEHKGQKFVAGLNARFANETTSRSERPGIGDPDLEEPVGGDTGLIFRDETRELVSVQPALEMELSQRNALSLRTRYTDVSFDESLAGRIDFTSYGGSIGWVHKLSQTSTISLRTDASQYKPDAPTARDADSYGADVEWARQFSDIRSTYVRAGFRRTQRDALPTDLTDPDAENSYVGGVGVKWEYEVTALFADLSSSVDPNASGVLVKRDQLRLQLRRRFQPKLAGTFGVRYIQDESLDDVVGLTEKRQYAIGTAEVEWRQTRTVSLMAQYNYRNQEIDSIVDRDADSNSVNLSVVYEPKRRD